MPLEYSLSKLIDSYRQEENKEESDRMIQDSGKRQEFTTGAVRDIQEGKGRCDLLPLDVVAKFLGDETVLIYLHHFFESGDVASLYSALGYFGVASPYSMILDVAIQFEEGAKKYGENNWKKGIPINCYINSAIRHYLKYKRGDTDERHDRAFIWNILCAIWTCDNLE